MEVTCLLDCQNVLGEGPLWDHRTGMLYWVDIKGHKLFSYDPSKQHHQVWQLPDEPGCIALRAEGGLLVALSKAIALIDLVSGDVNIIKEVLDRTAPVVFNDGKCDVRGRFWLGSKDIHESKPLGALYRFNPDHNITKMDEGFTVSNGIGWSCDQKIMYFTDSPAGKIYQYDFDIEAGTLHNRKIFANIPNDAGLPDGLTVDSIGYIWSAHWDGWRITRYDPDGTIERIIEMPVQKPTSCCFGGDDMTTLFVTSARFNLTQADLNKGPQAGGLFAIQTDIKGLTEPLYQG